MKISDELRKVADEYDVFPIYKLADRIDAEMVELPKDRDGAPIHVADTVHLEDGSKTKVRRIDFIADATDIVCWVRNRGYVPLNPSDVTHTRPDSFERIADELDEQAGSLTKDGYAWQEDAIHDFADRIRKLAKEEGDDDD